MQPETKNCLKKGKQINKQGISERGKEHPLDHIKTTNYCLDMTEHSSLKIYNDNSDKTLKKPIRKS